MFKRPPKHIIAAALACFPEFEGKSLKTPHSSATGCEGTDPETPSLGTSPHSSGSCRESRIGKKQLITLPSYDVYETHNDGQDKMSPNVL